MNLTQDPLFVVNGDGNSYVERIEKALELFRVDATLHELRELRSKRKRLLAYYEGRRRELAAELGL